MATLATLTARAASLATDPAGLLTDTDRQDAMREALARYGADYPVPTVIDVVADGTTVLPLTLPDGARGVLAIEAPAGLTPPSLLPPGSWQVVTVSGTPYLALSTAPNAGDTIRLTVALPPTIAGLDGATATTVPAAHEAALVSLAASRLLLRLANRFVHEQESVIAADGIDRIAKSDLAAKRARQLEDDYRRLLAGSINPQLVVLNWDLPTLSGGEFLTHDRWRR